MKIIIFNISNKNIFDYNKILSFYEDAGWWGESSEKDLYYIQKIMENSYVFCGLFLKEELIGMARSISDGVSDAYIQDVFILEKYRGRGYGEFLVKEIVSKLKEDGIDWVGLIGKPGTEKFYNRNNFKKMIDYVPMKLSE